MAEKTVARRLKIYVNGKEVDATITNLRKNLAKFRAQSNRAVQGSAAWKKYNKEVANLETELKQAYDAQRDFREETKLTEASISTNNQALSELSGSFSNLFEGIKTGDFSQISDGFKGVTKGIKGAVKASLAFIATPLGIALAVLVGVGAAAKKWFDYNAEIVAAIGLTQQLTGLNEQAADSVRIRAEALTETFGGEFKVNITQAKALVNQFGISYNKAFDIIENQLIRGQKNNEDFGDSITEYSTFFASAKFTAEEFGRVVAAGYDLSFYQDKLPDAIKEFDVAIKEQTPATRDALINAFGEPFTDKILKSVRIGKLSTKGALQEISKQADKTGLNLQQNAQLTADLFKGAGEDSGGALKIFEALDVALNKEQRELTESEQLRQDQIDTTKELKALSSSFFSAGDKGWGLLTSRVKLFGTKTLVKILQTGVDVYNWLVDLNNESGLFSSILTGVGIAATSSFSILGILLSAAWNSFKGLGNIVAGIFTLDWEQVKQGFSQGADALGGVITELKDKAVQDAQDIYEAFDGKNKLKRKSVSDFTSDETQEPVKDIKPLKDNLTADQKAEIKKRRELFETAEEALNKFIKEKLDERDLFKKSALEQELAAIDKKYASQIEKSQGHAEQLKEIEELRDQEKKELKLLRKRELDAELKELEDELAIEAGELKKEKEAEEAETEEERIRLLLAKTKWVADQELKIEYEKQLSRLKLFKATEEQIALVKKQYTQKQARLDFDYSKDKKKLKKDEVKWDQMTEDQKLNLVKSGLSQAAELFNKHTVAYKAIKISETLITTYQSAVNSYNSLSGIPYVGPVLGGLAAAAAVASGIAQIRKIASTKSEKMPSYSRGGDTGYGSLGLGRNAGGEIRGVVEEGEYVIPKFVRNDPEVPRIIDYLEAKRTGYVTSYSNGGDTSNPPLTTAFTETATDIVSTELLTDINNSIIRLNELLDQGLKINFTLEDEIKRQELEEKIDNTINQSIN